MRDGRNRQSKTDVKCATGEIVKAKQMLNAQLEQTPKQMTADFPNPGKRERVKSVGDLLKCHFPHAPAAHAIRRDGKSWLGRRHVKTDVECATGEIVKTKQKLNARREKLSRQNKS